MARTPVAPNLAAPPNLASTVRGWKAFRAIGVVALSFVMGCAGRSDFQKSLDEASDASEHRDYDLALRKLEQAEKIASDERSKEEARYRRARLLLQVERRDEAIALLATIPVEFPKGERAARACIDLGHLHEERGELDAARERYECVVLRYPASGNAASALERLVDLAGGSRAEALASWRPRLGDPELVEFVDYEHAKAQLATNVESATEEFEKLATTYPLPKGRFTDEALLAAARLRAKHGEWERATAHLETLSSAVDSSWFVGSYHRSSYVDALLLLGRIRREHFHDANAARVAFERIVSEFPDSRLRDDAEYELVLLESEKGGVASCEAMKRLVDSLPESRFCRCEPTVCAGSKGPEFCVAPKLSDLFE